MFNVGDVVVVIMEFYWYDEFYPVGKMFVFEEQHVGHFSESFIQHVDTDYEDPEELADEYADINSMNLMSPEEEAKSHTRVILNSKHGKVQKLDCESKYPTIPTK